MKRYRTVDGICLLRSLSLVALLTLPGRGEDEKVTKKVSVEEPPAGGIPKPTPWFHFLDPRQGAGIQHWFEKSGEVEDGLLISDALLIINWMPSPNGDFDVYQISGVDGYHSREHVETFLTEFYRPAPGDGEEVNAINVIVVGNNWGAGLGLKEILGKLSKIHKFDDFYTGGWAFVSAELIEEPESRKALIQKAHAKAKAKTEPKELAKP